MACLPLLCALVMAVSLIVGAVAHSNGNEKLANGMLLLAAASFICGLVTAIIGMVGKAAEGVVKAAKTETGKKIVDAVVDDFIAENKKRRDPGGFED